MTKSCHNKLVTYNLFFNYTIDANKVLSHEDERLSITKI